MIYFRGRWYFLFVWSLSPTEVHGYTLLGTTKKNVALNFVTFLFSKKEVATFKLVSVYGVENVTYPAYLNPFDGKLNAGTRPSLVFPPNAEDGANITGSQIE